MKGSNLWRLLLYAVTFAFAVVVTAVLALRELVWRSVAAWVAPVAAPIVRVVAPWVMPRIAATFARIRARAHQPTGPPLGGFAFC